MWGGIPSILLTGMYSDADFDAYLECLFRAVAPGGRFLLGFGDNVPTDALFSRVCRTAEFWEQRGAYPLPVPAFRRPVQEVRARRAQG